MSVEMAYLLGFLSGVGAWCLGTIAFVWWVMRDER